MRGRNKAYVEEGEMTKTYHCSEKSSNKFWTYELVGTNQLKISWGRCGLVGQNQVKTFKNSDDRQKFLNSKIDEKLRKGYKEITQKKLTEEVETAKSLGWQYKIYKIQWVSRRDNTLTIVPNYDGNKYVYVELLHSWNKSITWFLLNKTEAMEINVIQANGNQIVASNFLHTSGKTVDVIREKLRDVFNKVREKILSFNYVRKLSIDDSSEEITQEAMQEVMDIAVDDQAVSTQVYERFASMGTRILDI